MPALGSQVGYAEDTVVASAARTASGDSGVLTGYGGASTLRVQLQVTAASGTAPTLDVVVEDTLDGTNYNALGVFTQATGVTRQVVVVSTAFADRLRVRWTVGGTTPSFTFAVILVSQSAMS